MTNFTVVPYQKENGDIPIKDFLNSLDVKMRAKRPFAVLCEDFLYLVFYPIFPLSIKQ